MERGPGTRRRIQTQHGADACLDSDAECLGAMGQGAAVRSSGGHFRRHLWGGAFAHVQLFHDLYETPEGTSCRSWHSNFWLCGPNTFTGDSGVRIADVNGDGLADVVWNTVGAGCPYWENTCTGWPYSGGGYSGVLLNTGGGSAPYSAWCASNSAGCARIRGKRLPRSRRLRAPCELHQLLERVRSRDLARRHHGVAEGPERRRLARLRPRGVEAARDEVVYPVARRWNSCDQVAAPTRASTSPSTGTVSSRIRFLAMR